ncbi:MAG: valine--tRNA ligase [candidate division WOR-3 bacterium]|nr:MAG: valine--tRNA ligase [candidate division WOR-3 bacterium]
MPETIRAGQVDALDDFGSRYDPVPVEQKWYKFWEDKGFFTANSDSDKPKYSIVIPPPNVTGSLHMGHALDNGLPDVLIRRKKMQGYETLWLPGTDHAGIGTQVKVERMLAEEGLTRFDLGREKFLERVWEWKEKYGNRIVEQLRRLGCCLDWTRLRFTMDPMLARAVREAFVRYYEKGLIYRGVYIVNWCPRCGTAVSDLEVKYVEQDSSLWYIKYPLAVGGGHVVVATTRPETMLGDTGVAVNPGDERYRDIVGKMLRLPLTEREIPVVADQAVEMEFGTGAVKVTPAHDPADFEIGERHGLARIKVIGEDAKMTDDAPRQYRGMTREECRDQLVKDLGQAGLLARTEPYRHSVGTCDRCGDTIEPLASEQWFVKMKPLAGPAIEAVEGGRVKFHPERWNKVYLSWMRSIRDWCISRQLWWGHRIPVWYCPCGEIIVSREDPAGCPECGSEDISQDEDVLDTWFSSALWPFSTMGWPEDTPDLAKFYPTDFLTTDPDIIFRWEARMIFSALEFTGRVPFDDVYIHSTILAKGGERMSRSKGIGEDPLEMIDRYGTDAVRFVIYYLESQSQSYQLWAERFELGRNLCNKIWNACRLVAPSVREYSPTGTERTTPIDDWIMERFNAVLAKVDEGLDRYAFSVAAAALYDYFWHDLCDWYLEFAKQRMKDRDPAARATLRRVFRRTLQLLHPFMPFITEELWHRLGLGAGSILESDWPGRFETDVSRTARVESVRELIVAVRNIRSEMRVPAGKHVDCVVKTSDAGLVGFLEANVELVKTGAKVRELHFADERPAGSSIAVIPDAEVYVPLEGVVDIEREIERIRKEIDNVRSVVLSIDRKFSNPDFETRARPEVVESERKRRGEFAERLARLEHQLQSL